VYFALVHPFPDGNGRTVRLIELKILLSAGVPMPAAQLLNNHYNQTRTEYYRDLDIISKTNGNLVEFFKYANQGYIDGLKEQLDTIRGISLVLRGSIMFMSALG
jgi:Fic family protein